MKKTALCLTLAIVLAAGGVVSGCSGGLRFGGAVTEKIDVTGFTGVEIDGPFEATLTRSDAFSVTVSVQPAFRDYVSAVLEGDTLKIGLNPRHPFTVFPGGASTFRVKITMPQLSRLSLSGATKGTMADFKSTENLRLEVSGASSLKVKEAEAGDVELRVDGASHISGALAAKGIEMDVSGAGKVELAGSAEGARITASGASRVALLSVPVSTADVRLSGASQATLNVKEKLDVTLADASRLEFQGNPTVGRMNISGASTVKHR